MHGHRKRSSRVVDESSIGGGGGVDGATNGAQRNRGLSSTLSALMLAVVTMPLSLLSCVVVNIDRAEEDAVAGTQTPAGLVRSSDMNDDFVLHESLRYVIFI